MNTTKLAPLSDMELSLSTGGDVYVASDYDPSGYGPGITYTTEGNTITYENENGTTSFTCPPGTDNLVGYGPSYDGCQDFGSFGATASDYGAFGESPTGDTGDMSGGGDGGFDAGAFNEGPSNDAGFGDYGFGAIYA